MSQHVITATKPNLSLRRWRSLVTLALCTLLVAAVGFIVVQVVTNDSSTSSRPATRPVAASQGNPYALPADVPFVNPYARGDFSPTAGAIAQTNVPAWPADVPFVNPYARGDFSPTAPATPQANVPAWPADVPFVNPYARGDFSPTA